jgi:hypothetical protein
MKTVNEIENAVKSLVAKVSSGFAPSEFSIISLREKTAECLADIRADEAPFGNAEQPFWNLVMYDGDPELKALFLVTIFTPDYLRICAGEGLPGDVVASCQQFAMSDVSEFTVEFEARYSIGANSVDVPRSLAEYWLGQHDG